MDRIYLCREYPSEDLFGQRREQDLLENVQKMPKKYDNRGRLPEIVDFPTPPLADDTAITFRTS
jgi:hypothetical protein